MVCSGVEYFCCQEGFECEEKDSEGLAVTFMVFHGCTWSRRTSLDYWNLFPCENQLGGKCFVAFPTDTFPSTLLREYQKEALVYVQLLTLPLMFSFHSCSFTIWKEKRNLFNSPYNNRNIINDMSERR